MASQLAIVSSAAKKHGVPPAILWGVYGAESTWGRNGSNWFGLVAVPRTGSFAGDADASAATLAKLYKQYGSWESALRHYSGNGYGVTHVRTLEKQETDRLGVSGISGTGQAKTKSDPWYDQSIIEWFGGHTPDAPSLGGVAEAVTSVPDFLSKLAVVFQGGFWLRVGKILLGLLALYLGVQMIGAQFGMKMTGGKMPIPIPI